MSNSSSTHTAGQLESPGAEHSRAHVLPVPYPAVNRHGIIGDRRTSALVAADGTIDWLCLPDFDGEMVFASLLDAERGGFWKLGPAHALFGRQQYKPDTATLETRWDIGGAQLILTDLMLWPDSKRPPERKHARAIVRTLKCARGQIQCTCAIQLSQLLQPVKIERASAPSWTIDLPGELPDLSFWCNSGPIEQLESHAFDLEAGEEFTMVMSTDAHQLAWDMATLASAVGDSQAYWQDRLGRLSVAGPQALQIKRAAMLVRLLTYAPTGALVAASTTSVPERIGGDWNADYRFSWTRDSSLSLSLVAQLRDLAEAERYFQWLSQLESSSEMPLQVLYGIHGEHSADQTNLAEVAGYRGSAPVRVGNHACRQLQLDAFGYFAICAYDYLIFGGRWREEFWKLAQDVALFVADNWHKAGNGIWELPKKRHFVSSRVMSWAALDRISKIAVNIGRTEQVENWRSVMAEIHHEVMSRGWCPRLQAFRQHYEGENLDAAALLIPIVDFLPADHPWVLATVERIAERLSIDGFVYRFDPREMEIEVFDGNQEAMGQFEGAFLPCTFWLATVYAKIGQVAKAEAILKAVEEIAGPTGLLAEAIDPRNRTFLGNFPLLFSHAEHARAIMAIDKARKKE